MVRRYYAPEALGQEICPCASALALCVALDNSSGWVWGLLGGDGLLGGHGAVHVLTSVRVVPACGGQRAAGWRVAARTLPYLGPVAGA